MKLKQTALAVSAALGCMAAGSASAFDVFLSTATALRDTQVRALALFCDPGQPRLLTRSTAAEDVLGGSDDDFRVYDCTLKVGVPELDAQGLGGKTIRVYHTVEVNSALGGSIVGVVPIYNPVTMEFVNPVPGGGNTCIADGTTTISGLAWPRQTCSDRIDRIPDVGVSDTEPNSFTGPNLATGISLTATVGPLDTAAEVAAWQSPPTASPTAGNVTSAPFVAVGFGALVSDDLQLAGLTDITMAQFAAILNGSIDDWGWINPALGSRPIEICRRTQGSGTQASYNAMYNYNPCLTSPGIQGALSIATQFDSGPLGNLTVIENSASSGVRTCVASRSNAIGLLSLETNEPPAGAVWIKINGITYATSSAASEPGSVDGVVDGIYEDVMIRGQLPIFQESTIQWNATGPRRIDTNCAAGANCGDVLGYAQLARDSFGAPQFTVSLPGVVSVASYYGSTGGPIPKNIPLDATLGVMHYTRNGNSCQPPVFSAF